MILVHSLPFYWGIETDAPDRSFITRSTLHEVWPPFRQSIHAFRIRVSHRHWLHIGTYHYDPIAGRWGTNVPIEEISTWRGPDVGQEAEEGRGEGSESEPVRPVVASGTDRLSRSRDAKDSGTFPRVLPH